MARSGPGSVRRGAVPGYTDALIEVAHNIASPSELAFQVNANSSIRRIDHRDVIVNAFLGNDLEGGPANLFLRRHGARIVWTPLLGPRSPGTVQVDEH